MNNIDNTVSLYRTGVLLTAHWNLAHSVQKVSCMKKSWHDNFMNEDLIFMHGNLLFSCMEISFSWMKMIFFLLEIIFSCMKLFVLGSRLPVRVEGP